VKSVKSLTHHITHSISDKKHRDKWNSKKVKTGGEVKKYCIDRLNWRELQAKKTQ